ncbi:MULTISPECIES: hypothetical protein [unclassified Curtobacterium]|uniref:hypothetical protein n=1 Tax=unclassified Curtobacterium TaxID=257496 RepID=UPI0037FB439C
MRVDDGQIGRNLRRLRERLTDSDAADLALRMRLRGWAWTEDDVDAVENGDRPLLHAEAVDVMRAFGFSEAFISMPTDAESEAEIADQQLRRAEGDLREAVDEWLDDASRYAGIDEPAPTTIDTVLASGRAAFADPGVVLGEPDADDRTTTFADWAGLEVRPPHPLDLIEAGQTWLPEQVRIQLDHDLRQSSHRLRYATLRWLRAEAGRAPHWPDEPRGSLEQVVAQIRQVRATPGT